MGALLQLSLIATLVATVSSWGTLSYPPTWVNLQMGDLHIPDDNSVVKGEKQNINDTWYSHVNWMGNPSGNLKLSYKLMGAKTENWWLKTEKTAVDIYANGPYQQFDIARLVRKALGLSNCNVKRPGKVRVSSTLFSKDKPLLIHMGSDYYDEFKYRFIINVTDDKGHVYLTGQLIIPQG